MHVHLRPANADDRPLLEPMLAAYTRAIAAFSDIPSLDRTLEAAWFEHPDLHPYVIEVEGAPGGMALVMGPDHAVAVGEPCDRMVYDYFVDEQWRGRGVARAAAQALFDTCPGRWAISVIEANKRAVCFWRAALQERGVEPEVGPGPEGLPTFRFVIASPRVSP